MKTKNIEDIYPLSPMQHGMLFHSLYSPNTGMYFEQFTCKVHDVDLEAFSSVWQKIFNRHAILRTAFVWKDLDSPLQFVRRNLELPLNILDWREKTQSKLEVDLNHYLSNDRIQGFNLSKAPLMRLSMIRITDSSYYFIWSLHHILMDAWSINILLKEIATLYSGTIENKTIDFLSPIPYSNYISWIKQQDKTMAENFWRKTLSGLTSPTNILPPPATSKKELLNTFEYEIKLSPHFLEEISLFTKKYHLTTNTLIQATWALLCQIYTHETDIIFGYTTSTRPIELKNSDSMVGLFINTLPLRLKIPTDDLVSVWLSNIQTQLLLQEQYSYCSLVDIQGWSDIPRGSPLFETIVVFENYPIEKMTSVNNKLKISDVQLFEKMNYALHLVVMPHENLSIKLRYNDADLEQEFVASLAKNYSQLLRMLTENPNRKIRDISALTEEDKHQITVEWNNTLDNFPLKSLYERFSEQAQTTPNAIAISLEHKSFTYRELNERANQLAHYLKDFGVGPEVLVGLSVERSLEMVIGLLGIWKAGGAYVPFDPSHPQDRLLFMLQDTSTPIILTQRKFKNSLPQTNTKLICLDSDWHLIQPESIENPKIKAQLDDLAYVIYTSGTTGNPKGVMVSHRAIANRVLWSCINYPIRSNDHLVQVASLNFDISLWEICAPLIVGARLVILPPKNPIEISTLINTIVNDKVTILHLVPALLSVLLEHPKVLQCKSLKIVITGGELLTKSLHQKFISILNAKLFHTYGPTEASISVTHWECSDQNYSKGAPIGKPISNTQLYILDKDLKPVPVGVAGELHIGGTCVARGYLNNPELTREKFISCPFENDSNKTLYKTGDYARYISNGNIEYLYRIDTQTKINGYRIELNELENILLQHAKVRECIVLVKERPDNIKYLVVYVSIYSGQTAPTNKELEDFLSQKLPQQMIPSVYHILDKFPLTLNGKIDKQALLEIQTTTNTISQNLPTDYFLRELAKIWEETLGVSSINPYDNFFDLGGHSLLAVKLMTLIEKKFKKHIPMNALFQNPTLKSQADLLRTNIVIEPNKVIVPIQASGDRNPLFCIHPIGGSVFCYMTLSKHLGNQQPLYGLQQPVFNEPNPDLWIENLAKHYIKAMQTIQPTGPYQVLGWSFGGILAYEIATQLKNHDQEVSSLTLIDSFLPNSTNLTQIIDDNELTLFWVKDLYSSMGKSFTDQSVKLKGLDHQEQLEFICKKINQDGLFPIEIALTYLESILSVFKKNIEGLINYHPKPYEGDIAIYYADKTENDFEKIQMINHWTHLISGNVKLHKVACSHYEILQEPHINLLTKELKSLFNYQFNYATEGTNEY